MDKEICFRMELCPYGRAQIFWGEEMRPSLGLDFLGASFEIVVELYKQSVVIPDQPGYLLSVTADSAQEKSRSPDETTLNSRFATMIVSYMQLLSLPPGAISWAMDKEEGMVTFCFDAVLPDDDLPRAAERAESIARHLCRDGGSHLHAEGGK